MKQLKNFTLKFVGVMIAVMAFVFGFTSCNDDTATDSSSFALYYTSMTDISPTMTGTIASPTYKGATPSGFTITGVTFGDDDQPYTGDSFVIDETTGAVTISNTSELQIGKYKISVSCIAGGKSYYFQDAIIVNFMKAVPDGITVEPAELQVEYADILNTEDQTITLPTAQVKTDGEHISITGYEISSIRKGEQIIENFPNPLFAISSTGEISVVRGNQSIEIGTYILNLKLNTAVAGSDSELGLYADAVKINVISKPLSLNYEPNEDLLEESTTNETEYLSKEPILEGSLEGVNYSIASISPSTDKITIDPTTGKIVVAKGHGFSNGESYTVSVLVKNQFCEEGVVFEDVFKLNIVEFIEPIANFSYPETTVKQALKIDVQKNPGFQGGGNLTFAFSEEDKTKYDGILTLDEKTGEISAPKYNTLEIGNYEVHVIATNNKTPEGVEAVLRLNINENENYFTTINYGNNLGEGGIELDGEIYNNQFRFTGTSGANGKTFSPKSLDLKGSGQTVKWSISLPRDLAGTTIDQSTGTITLAGTSNKQIRFALITAKVGNNEEEAIERTVPFFVSIYDKNNQANVLYTPFVFHVNPEIGGTSVPPVVNKESVAKMDFRRDFFYINIDGVDTDGIDLISNTVKLGDSNHDNFLGAIWDKYYEKAGKSEYGSKGPVSYYLNEGKLNSAMAYIDNVNDFSIVVPPNRWYADGWADGVFFGQIVFGDADDTIDYIDGSDNPNKINPVVIWFDKNYNPEKN